jgi:hypothetical protein
MSFPTAAKRPIGNRGVVRRGFGGLDSDQTFGPLGMIRCEAIHRITDKGKQTLSVIQNTGYTPRMPRMCTAVRKHPALPPAAVAGPESDEKKSSSEISRNSLKNIDSDERIQGNPRKSNPLIEGLSGHIGADKTIQTGVPERRGEPFRQ